MLRKNSRAYACAGHGSSGDPFRRICRVEAVEDKPADNSQNQAGYCAEGVKIRRTINLAATRSCFVTGMTSAYFSHFDMLSKEKVVMTIMLHSTQEVVI